MSPTPDVRAQLQRIVQSSTFRSAEALRNLLAFVVDEALAGRAQNLKEYILGAMVLGKGTSFDPKIDPIVRVQMQRLRQHLHQYYATEGKHDPIVIDLARGTYVPTFHDNAPPGDEPTNGYRDGWSAFAAGELHLRARYLLAQMSVASVREAAALVEGVVQKQPSFAPAYATLAECYRAFLVLEMMPPADVVPKMKAACMEALKLDPDSAEARAAFASVLAWEWNFVGAEPEYGRAMRCGPSNAVVHRRYAIHLAATGRFAAAIDCARRACELDPLSAACEQTRGVVHYWARDFEESHACARRALAIAPNFGLAHHLAGGLLLHHHQYAEAIDALERATSLSGASTFDLGYQAWGLGCAGERIKACQILEGLVAAAQREYVAPLSIAHCYLGLGDLDEALTWVERAYVPGMSQWPYYLAAPLYEPLFRYKRFQSVLERIGLPRPLVVS